MGTGGWQWALVDGVGRWSIAVGAGEWWWALVDGNRCWWRLVRPLVAFHRWWSWRLVGDRLPLLVYGGGRSWMMVGVRG